MEEILDGYRQQAVEAAKDLHYGTEVYNKLKTAKSEDEITRIMKTAKIGGIEND